MREAMASEIKGEGVGGAGRDRGDRCGLFGGSYPRREPERGSDRSSSSSNQTGKRKAVIVARQRGGRAIAGVFPSETDSLGWIKSRVAKGTVIHADESSAWNPLHSRYKWAGSITRSLQHRGICTNQAESFFSRLRRGELGHHHRIAGTYLLNFAKEAAWRENNRRVSNGGQVRRVVTLAMASKPSVDFSGYWQRGAQ
jgi:hypothetical protein